MTGRLIRPPGAESADPPVDGRRHARHRRAMAHRAVGPLDRLGPLRPDRDEHDRHAGRLLQRGHVAPGVLGQLGQRPDVVDRLGPAREALVDRGRPGEDLGARRPALDPLAVDLVGDAQEDLVDPGQDVDLVEHDAADAVDGDGVAQRHRVEPADPARPPGHRPELVAALGDPGPDRRRASSVGYGPEPTRVV